MEGRWLAFCAGVGTGYALGLATYRWLWHHADGHVTTTSLASSLQSLTAEVSSLRQALSEAGTQFKEVRRDSIRSARISKPESDAGSETDEFASLGRCA